MTQAVSRGLLRSMLIIGAAKSASILISIARMKVVAVLLGPPGLGLLAIYNSLMHTASTVAGLGLGSSGVRELASSRGDEAALSRVRVVLFSAHLIQGLLAMAAIWLLRAPLARLLMGHEAHATEVGLVGISVLLTLLATSQTALLQGLRKISDLGRVTVLGALAGTVAGVLAVWSIGMEGLVWFVLVQPLTAILVARFYTRRLPRPAHFIPTPRVVWEVWRPMATLGFVFMLGGLATTATQLIAQSLIIQYLGLGAVGIFAAAWGITMLYVGFLLTAMGTDYYPRLAEIVTDREATNRLINEQIQLGLAIGGPVLLLLIGLAPWLIILLYSAEFGAAIHLLQWQTVGNVFKLACWPIGFAFVAAARSWTFTLIQFHWNLVYLLFLFFGLPAIGLTIAGIGFLVAYFLHFMLLILLARTLLNFKWERLSLQLIALHGVLSFGLLAMHGIPPYLLAAISVVFALATGLFGLRLVTIKLGSDSRIAQRISKLFATIGWPI